MSNSVTGHSAAYIAELKKRLNAHRKWVNGGRGGIHADLSFYDMSQLPLSGAMLRNAKLVGTSFARSNLSKADLKAAILMMADAGCIKHLIQQGLGILPGDGTMWQSRCGVLYRSRR